MSETTGTINCPECGMSFDTRDELERHARQSHAAKKASTEKTGMPSFEERVQSKTEEKGKGEATGSIEHE
jgi:uncharacterized C2H2 Zn-finger protein